MYKFNIYPPQTQQKNYKPFVNCVGKEFAQEKTMTKYNISENSNAFKLEIALPGITKKDIDLNVEKELLGIRINTQNESAELEKFLKQEFNYHSFHKQFKLPQTVDSEKIEAEIKKGLLTINLPKKEPTTTTKRDINIT